jgi:hypothetical protein
MQTYKIVRLFFNSNARRVIRRRLTLSEAQRHCQDPETSSSTCTKSAGKRRTKLRGRWFDSYTKE